MEGKQVIYVLPDEDFELITYDIVNDPGFSSQTFNILKESYEEILDSKLYGDKLEKYVIENLYKKVKNYLKEN